MMTFVLAGIQVYVQVVEPGMLPIDLRMLPIITRSYILYTLPLTSATHRSLILTKTPGFLLEKKAFLCKTTLDVFSKSQSTIRFTW